MAMTIMLPIDRTTHSLTVIQKYYFSILSVSKSYSIEKMQLLARHMAKVSSSFMVQEPPSSGQSIIPIKCITTFQKFLYKVATGLIPTHPSGYEQD